MAEIISDLRFSFRRWGFLWIGACEIRCYVTSSIKWRRIAYNLSAVPRPKTPNSQLKLFYCLDNYTWTATISLCTPLPRRLRPTTSVATTRENQDRYQARVLYHKGMLLRAHGGGLQILTNRFRLWNECIHLRMGFGVYPILQSGSLAHRYTLHHKDITSYAFYESCLDVWKDGAPTGGAVVLGSAKTHGLLPCSGGFSQDFDVPETVW